MHVSSNRLWHKSQRTQTFRNCSAARCVYEGCLLFLKQLSLLTSVILSALYPGVFQNQCLKYIVLCLSVCFFNKLIFLLSSPSLPPAPQVCRFYSGDAEADPGADAGRRITVLYLVHTNLPEQIHSPPLHCRWVHSSVTVKVTLHTCSAAGRLGANMNSVSSSGFFFSLICKVHSGM